MPRPRRKPAPIAVHNDAPETVPISATEPLRLTEDEAAILKGCMGRKDAIVLRARAEMAALAQEEAGHLLRIAKRLGIEDPSGYEIDVESLEVRPK